MKFFPPNERKTTTVEESFPEEKKTWMWVRALFFPKQIKIFQ